MSDSGGLDTWGYPGHLSEAQQEVLATFLSKTDPADIELAKFKVESIESVCLRFLRARAFNTVKALALLKECVDMKRSGGARRWASLPADECACCDVEALKIWYPHSQLGFDRYNRPVLFERSGKVDGNAIRQMTSMENLIKYHWHTMEFTLNNMFEEASLSSKGPSLISTCAVLDLQGMNSHHVSSKVLDHIRALIAIDNVCYPELLGKMLVVNAPWLAVSCWEMVKHWLDPRTQGKIEILGSGAGMQKRLRDFIPPEKLPISLGGSNASFEHISRRTHAEYTHIPRYGAIKKSLLVPKRRWIDVETYTTDGEIYLEIFQCTRPTHAVNHTHTCEAIPMSEVLKIRGKTLDNSLHLLLSREIKVSSETPQSSQQPLRTVINLHVESDQLLTIMWINHAKFYTRPLTYNLITRETASTCVSLEDTAADRKADNFV